MLDQMRRKTVSWIGMFLFVVVILAFIISFGPGSFRRAHFGAEDDIAKVNGEIISKFDFDQNYDRYKPYERNMPEDKIDSFKRNILDGMVADMLWKQEAAKMKIKISDDALAEYILANPNFQEDGKFSAEMYHSRVGNAKAYEANLRVDLATDLLRKAIQDLSYASKEEAWENYKISNTKVDLEFIMLDGDKAEALGYKAEAKEEDLKKFIAANESKIKDYYDLNRKEFDKPERATVDQGVITVEEGESVSVARDRAAKVKNAASGKSLGDAAKTVKGAQFKDNAELRKGEIEKELETAVFSAKPGDLLGPIQIKGGEKYYVVMLKEIKPEEKSELNDSIKSTIAKKLYEAEAKENFLKTKANDYLAQLMAGKTVNDVVPYEKDEEGETTKKPIEQDPKSGVSSGRTKPFPRGGGAVRGIGFAPDIMNAAFKLTKEAPVAGPFVVNGSVYIIRLLSLEEATKEKFESEYKTESKAAHSEAKKANLAGYVYYLKKNSKIEIKDHKMNEAAKSSSLPFSLDDY